MDALALLHQDHVKVGSLFDQYVMTDDREGKNWVVDQILSQVKVVDQPVTKEALFGDDEGEEAASEPKKAKGGKKAGKSE